MNWNCKVKLPRACFSTGMDFFSHVPWPWKTGVLCLQPWHPSDTVEPLMAVPCQQGCIIPPTMLRLLPLLLKCWWMRKQPQHSSSLPDLSRALCSASILNAFTELWTVSLIRCPKPQLPASAEPNSMQAQQSHMPWQPAALGAAKKKASLTMHHRGESSWEQLCILMERMDSCLPTITRTSSHRVGTNNHW